MTLREMLQIEALAKTNDLDQRGPGFVLALIAEIRRLRSRLVDAKCGAEDAVTSLTQGLDGWANYCQVCGEEADEGVSIKHSEGCKSKPT